MKKLLATISLFFIALLLLAFTKPTVLPSSWRNYLGKKLWVINRQMKVVSDPPGYITASTVTYESQLETVENQRLALAKAYNDANATEKPAALSHAKDYLYNTLVDSVAPYWYGTPWDFNGITRVPQEGKIACGYFVFTLLQDMGYNLPRVKLSQAASEPAIKALAGNGNIKRHSNASIEKYVKDMKAWGDGFYLVGLDYHIGMLQVKGDECWFIHSTVIYPKCVVKEDAISSPALRSSSYRISGKISANDALTKKWLTSGSITM